MRRVKSSVTIAAALLMAALLGGYAGPGMATYVERITGTVQDWSAEKGYVLVDGISFRMSDDVYLVDEAGVSLPLSHLRIGTSVSLLEKDGVVYEIALVREER